MEGWAGSHETTQTTGTQRHLQGGKLRLRISKHYLFRRGGKRRSQSKTSGSTRAGSELGVPDTDGACSSSRSTVTSRIGDTIVLARMNNDAATQDRVVLRQGEEGPEDDKPHSPP